MSTNVETATGKLVWHDHRSKDVAKATAFYAELFGWEYEVFEPETMKYPMIKANGGMHGGFGAIEGDEPPHWIGHVLVEDADEAAAKAEAAGGAVLGKMDIPSVGRLAVIADPQGAVVSAFQGTSDPGSPPAEGTFVWDELTTTDVEAAKSFYGQVFGWKAKDEDLGGMTYTVFRRNDDDPGVGGCMAVPEGMQAPPHWLVYIHTDDTDASVAKAKELGATVFQEGMDIPEIGRIAVLQDPTGAAFGLFQAPPE